MKKAFLFSVAMLISVLLIGQEPVRRQEIGLTFTSLNSFGLTYRIGTSSLLRFNTFMTSAGGWNIAADSSSSMSRNFSTGLKAGKEYRRNLNDNLALRIGADISFDYSHSISDTDDISIDDQDRENRYTRYQPGINLVFGFNYALGDHFTIGAELLPGVRYSISTTRRNSFSDVEKIETIRITGISGSLSTSGVLFSLVYKL